jgi:hypothetical protein
VTSASSEWRYNLSYSTDAGFEFSILRFELLQAGCFVPDSAARLTNHNLRHTSLEVEMVSKCANPSCHSAFHYLGNGKLFRFERCTAIAEDPAIDDLTSMRKPPSSVEHFWLCDICATRYTLRVDRNRSVIAVPLASPAVRRAAA